MGSGEVRRRESYLRALSDNLAVLSKALAIAALDGHRAGRREVLGKVSRCEAQGVDLRPTWEKFQIFRNKGLEEESSG